jgi:hypothetical protein
MDAGWRIKVESDSDVPLGPGLCPDQPVKIDDPLSALADFSGSWTFGERDRHKLVVVSSIDAWLWMEVGSEGRRGWAGKCEGTGEEESGGEDGEDHDLVLGICG